MNSGSTQGIASYTQPVAAASERVKMRTSNRSISGTSPIMRDPYQISVCFNFQRPLGCPAATACSDEPHATTNQHRRTAPTRRLANLSATLGAVVGKLGKLPGALPPAMPNEIAYGTREWGGLESAKAGLETGSTPHPPRSYELGRFYMTMLSAWGASLSQTCASPWTGVGLSSPHSVGSSGEPLKSSFVARTLGLVNKAQSTDSRIVGFR